MITLKDICDALRDIGIREVILGEEDGIPTIAFYGRDLRITAKNADFAENDL